MDYQKGSKQGYGIGYKGLFSDDLDHLASEVERLEAEIETLKAENDELLEQLESGASGMKQRAYWKVAISAIEYIEGCSRKRVVPLIHDANEFRKKLNRAHNDKELK